MRVVLVGPELEENLALRYLAAALSDAGHDCTIVPFDRTRDVGRVARGVLAAHPEMVGFSLVAQRRYRDFRSLSARLRAAGWRGHLTAGGHFASLRAAEILGDTAQIDSVVHHDGEARLVALADALAATGRMPDEPDGLTWRDDAGALRHAPPRGVADLDALATPRRRRQRQRTLGVGVAPLVASRGCAGRCSFCSIHAWHRQVPASARVRLRAPERVADEMIDLHRRHGVRAFVFHDDDFLPPDPAAARERCRRILEPAARAIGPLAFVIKCRPDQVDAGLFAELRDRGLVRVFVGIESHAASGLRALRRDVRPAANTAALATLRRLGVLGCFNLLLFHPDTTPAELAENLDFLGQQLDLPFDVGRTELYAQATLEMRMRRDGRALGDWRGYDYRIADPVAQAVFSLFESVLWTRHFGARPLPARIQDLGFRLGLLRRFHPESATPELAARVADLIRDFNADTVAWLGRLSAAAAHSGGDAQAAGLLADVTELRREVAARHRAQTTRWAALMLELEGRATLGRAGLGRLPLAGQSPRLVARLAATVPLLALAAVSLSCDRTGIVCDPVPPPVHFHLDIAPRLDSTCATANCHAATAPAAGLDLTTGASYGHLVNVPSTQAPGMKLVRPGRTDSSYVVHKLNGTQAGAGGSGDRMPPGTIDSGTLGYLIERWIEEGARDD